MDQDHDGNAAPAAPRAAPAVPLTPPADSPLPQDDDERFIVGLVLTYYRRHPQRARTRLLDLLGEVLMAAGAPAAAAPPPKPAREGDDAHALWLKSQTGTAPLRPKGGKGR
jgi:hypothetical protein